MSVVWRLTVTLRDVYPSVWRTILVRPNTKLAMLHRYLQAAMGWEDYHLFSFTIGERRYIIPHRDNSPQVKTYDPRRYTLDRLFSELPAQFSYLYDFGDHWEHDVVISGAEEAAYRKQYPICIDGAGDCPPEDCGGVPGFRMMQFHGDWPPQGYYRSFWVQGATWALRDVPRGGPW